MAFTLSTGGFLFDVLDGAIAMSIDGVPIATLELPEDAAPALGEASILVAEEGAVPVVFVGTLVFSRAYEGRVSVSWVGGAGVLGGTSTALHYTAIAQPVRLADIVRALVAGEQLVDDTLAELDGLTLDRWTRFAGEAWSKALDRALEGTGRRWRILDTGRVWVGVETWPAADLDGLELDEDKAGQVLRVAFDRATLRPGTSLPDGRHVHRVVFGCDGFVDVHLGEDLAGVRALAGLVGQHLLPDPYARVWNAEVIAQHEDLTLDLRAIEGDGAPFEDLPRVPFDTGVQGARFVIPSKAIVRVRFLEASPKGALAFGRPSDPEASRGIARHGDHGVAGTLQILGAAALTITYTPPGGKAANVGTITATAGNVPVTFAGSVTIDLEQLIDTASKEVFLR